MSTKQCRPIRCPGQHWMWRSAGQGFCEPLKGRKPDFFIRSLFFWIGMCHFCTFGCLNIIFYYGLVHRHKWAKLVHRHKNIMSFAVLCGVEIIHFTFKTQVLKSSIHIQCPFINKANIVSLCLTSLFQSDVVQSHLLSLIPWWSNDLKTNTHTQNSLWTLN